MRKARTAALVLLSWLIYPLSHLTPRNKRVWIFIGWYKSKERETFADNSKYFFLYTAQNCKNIRAIWMAQDDAMRDILRAHGYESYNIHSVWGAYYSLRAGYTIIDAVMQLRNWRYSGRSKVVQLWHADGIKSLTLRGRGIHFLIASSPFIAKHFTAPSFNLPQEKVRITGLPRYDVFFDHIKDSDIDLNLDLKEKLQAVRAKNPKKVIMYGPTFRRGRSAAAQLSHVDLPALDDFLRKNDFFLFLSLHPKFSASEWLPDKKFSNILFMNADYDFYPLLPQFDTIITDYSSTCLEFLLLDKPAIFYVYDFEEYKKNPGIPEEFWGLVPGPRVKTFEELLRALEAPDTLQTERQRVRDILFTFEKGNASKAVAESVLVEIT